MCPKMELKDMRRRLFKLLLASTLLLSMMGVVGGCNGRLPMPAEDETKTDSSENADTLVADTVADLVDDAPLPKAVDELFDDFFFNFAGNHKMQLSRIQFPLPIHKDGTTAMLERRQWKFSYFFMSAGYYTMLFDNEAQDSLTKSTAVSHATVEKLYLNENLMKLYDFERINGEWRLTSVTHARVGDHSCASFLHFYEQFASDTVSQVRSLDNFVVMTAPDDDEDFEELTGSIMPEQWPTFKPEIIPEGIIYCVNYGQTYSDASQKVLFVRGIANGLNTVLTFQRKNNGWKLVKFRV